MRACALVNPSNETELAFVRAQVVSELSNRLQSRYRSKSVLYILHDACAVC